MDAWSQSDWHGTLKVNFCLKLFMLMANNTRTVSSGIEEKGEKGVTGSLTPWGCLDPNTEPISRPTISEAPTPHNQVGMSGLPFVGGVAMDGRPDRQTRNWCRRPELREWDEHRVLKSDPHTWHQPWSFPVKAWTHSDSAFSRLNQKQS